MNRKKYTFDYYTCMTYLCVGVVAMCTFAWEIEQYFICCTDLSQGHGNLKQLYNTWCMYCTCTTLLFSFYRPRAYCLHYCLHYWCHCQVLYTVYMFMYEEGGGRDLKKIDTIQIHVYGENSEIRQGDEGWDGESETDKRRQIEWKILVRAWAHMYSM